jgi:hypothetical protein
MARDQSTSPCTSLHRLLRTVRSTRQRRFSQIRSTQYHRRSTPNSPCGYAGHIGRSHMAPGHSMSSHRQSCISQSRRRNGNSAALCSRIRRIPLFTCSTLDTPRTTRYSTHSLTRKDQSNVQRRLGGIRHCTHLYTSGSPDTRRISELVLAESPL